MQPLPTGRMCRLGGCKKGDESIEGEVHVQGAAERHGLSAGRDTATVHSVVAVGVPCVPAAAARQMHASETASAPSSRTALRQSGPLKPLHRPLEAACGWLCWKDERCIANHMPQWRQRPCASRGAVRGGRGCFRVRYFLSYYHSADVDTACCSTCQLAWRRI